MNSKLTLLHGLLLVVSLAGCGGGGGGTTAPQAVTATLKLSTSGTQTSLAGIGITVTLPAGVTVKTDANGAVLSGMVTVSGVAAPGTVLAPSYTPASGGNPATVTFAMASNATAGFGIGEFATITCDRAQGITPQPADFPLTGFNPFDLNGNPVGNLTASVAIVLN